MGSFIDKVIHWFKYTVIPWYTSLGLTKGTVTLEVLGSRSGKPLRVSVTTVRQGASRYVVSLYDQSKWVKNVRAAQGRAMLLSGSRTHSAWWRFPFKRERSPYSDMFSSGHSVT